jgi:hypothetical protein
MRSLNLTIFALVLAGCAAPQPAIQPVETSYHNSRTNGACVVNMVRTFEPSGTEIVSQIRGTCLPGDQLTFNDMLAMIEHGPPPPVGLAATVCDMNKTVLRSSGSLVCVYR